jgi:hypothetical protein
LKGWIDRVLIAGWAFKYGNDGRVIPRLQHITAHLIPMSGTAESSFQRHGYSQSFGTQVEVGIVDFCGMRRGVTAFVHDSESHSKGDISHGIEDAASAAASAIGMHSMLILPGHWHGAERVPLAQIRPVDIHCTGRRRLPRPDEGGSDRLVTRLLWPDGHLRNEPHSAERTRAM